MPAECEVLYGRDSVSIGSNRTQTNSCLALRLREDSPRERERPRHRTLAE